MIPGYMMAGYGYYDEYLESEEWYQTKQTITNKYPRSKYCWICDKTTSLNLHHENYAAIPKEKFMKDVLWLCHDHHTKVHKLSNGEKTPLLKQHLLKRRLELRREYLKQYIRPTTLVPFLKRWLYRQFF